MWSSPPTQATYVLHPPVLLNWEEKEILRTIWTKERPRAWEQRQRDGEWPCGQPVGFGPAGPWPESHGGERCPSQALIGHVGAQHERRGETVPVVAASRVR